MCVCAPVCVCVCVCVCVRACVRACVHAYARVFTYFELSCLTRVCTLQTLTIIIIIMVLTQEPFPGLAYFKYSGTPVLEPPWKPRKQQNCLERGLVSGKEWVHLHTLIVVSVHACFHALDSFNPQSSARIIPTSCREGKRGQRILKEGCSVKRVHFHLGSHCSQCTLKPWPWFSNMLWLVFHTIKINNHWTEKYHVFNGNTNKKAGGGGGGGMKESYIFRHLITGTPLQHLDTPSLPPPHPPQPFSFLLSCQPHPHPSILQCSVFSLWVSYMALCLQPLEVSYMLTACQGTDTDTKLSRGGVIISKTPPHG